MAFSSRANNLVPGDTNLIEDIFVRDRLALTTERVSVSSGGQQGGFPGTTPPPPPYLGDHWFTGVCVSADGRFVAFSSIACNLVPGDDWYSWDVFLHDRLTHTTERLQHTSYSEQTCISADGRSVAFVSQADNLVPGDTNGVPDVFVVDRGTASRPALCVRFSLPKQVYPGQVVQCSIVCLNAGTADLKQVEVGVEVPAGFWVGDIRPAGTESGQDAMAPPSGPTVGLLSAVGTGLMSPQVHQRTGG
ncbi:MAG: hypothetical protein N3E40_06040, partial [Dehalococcoidia bacterium]|nr:hypothetical protein [Dehalococcoidia bacterium]